MGSMKDWKVGDAELWKH